MFRIDADMTIHITRGDICVIEVSAVTDNNETYIFKPGDVVRLRVYPKKKHESVSLIKDVIVDSESEIVAINLGKTDTKIGDIINKPAVYWYEVELNPDTTPQTFIGYDTTGPKLFMLYPEGGDKA